MKNIIFKRSIFVGILVMSTLLVLVKAEANERSVEDNIKVTIINDLTKEEVVLDNSKIIIESKKNSDNGLLRNNLSKAETENFEVLIPSKEFGIAEEVQISPRASESGGKTAGGVKASVTVSYDISANNEKIKVKQIQGSWTPTANYYNLSGRNVWVHSGLALDSKELTKKPTTNTFSYNTGWGYNNRIGGVAAPRAQTTAKVTVSGMSGSTTIVVDFTFGKP